MSYNLYKNSFLCCLYQFPDAFRLAMFFTVQEEHFKYIPLSSFILLLVIVFTCASRKRKLDSFTAAEQSLENDIKGDYAIMCFPCLKKKPVLQDYEPTPDMADQFEYIVEKYTIRKVPLLLANTAEDIIERQVEMEMAEAEQNSPELLNCDDFVNFNMSQEPQCVTVAANTICPARKSAKDKCMPSDVLESMSPIPRPNVKNANYVVIPTKGSLRSKDIMITKREITNQYLNNFSSVFVDNLKDQIPKDPERFPNLSRPYTSAFKNLPLAETFLKAKTTNEKKIKRSKVQKVAYSFPAEDIYSKEDESIKEEEPYYDSDSGSKGQTTDILESEFQEDNENETVNMTDKSKSLVLLNDSDSAKDALESIANPFKTTIKSSGSEFIPRNPRSEFEYQSNSFSIPKEDWTNAKVTYEDIQALDVGYEFTSCEKLGVKPKMTRIHYPHEGDRTKDAKQVGEPKKNRKNLYVMEQAQHQISSPKVARSNLKSKGHQRISDLSFLSGLSHLKEKPSSKCSIAETSFLPKKDSSGKPSQPDPSNLKNRVSTTTFTSKSEESKSQSLNDIDVHETPSETLNESVAEISKLYDLAMPLTKSGIIKSNVVSCETEPTATAVVADHSNLNLNETTRTSSAPKFPIPSKSRSFQESRKEIVSEVKGKNYTVYPSSFVKNKSLSRLDEPDTETSCSMLSRESKTSSAVTSPRSSEREEGKRATLRWKIVIKHHREEDSSRKHLSNHEGNKGTININERGSTAEVRED